MTEIQTVSDHDPSPVLSLLAEAEAELDQYGPGAPGAEARVQACTPRGLAMDDLLRALGCDV